MDHRNLTLLTDLYELTMMQGYFKEKDANETVIFDMFYRTNPHGNGFAICAGLEQAIEYIKGLHFDESDIEYLRSLNIFAEDFLEYLSTFRFTGDIYAIPEGTVVFPRESLIKVIAPIMQAQLVETALLTIINHQSLIATKTERIVHAAKGDGVKGKTVTIPIDQDREIVEEVEQKDVSLLGVEGLIAKRTANHALRMAAELDTKFFEVAGTDATEVDLTGITAIEEIAEKMIQQCETTKNEYVDGVPRLMMHMVLDPDYYGKIRTCLDKVTVPGVGAADEEFYAFHGVKTYSCVHLPTDVKALVMVDGAIAQPVMSDPYNAEKIPLSNAYGIELFYHFGTKSVTPDLIFKNKKIGG